MLARGLESKYDTLYSDSHNYSPHKFQQTGNLRTDNRQAFPPKQKKRMNMNRPTISIAKQTKARIQPKPNKQTAKSAENIYAIKRKKKA